MSVAVVLVVALSLLSVLVAFVNRRRNALIAKLPGFFLFVPVFGNLLELLVRMVLFKRDHIELNLMFKGWFGPVYRIWVGHTPYVVVCDPEDVEVVLTHPAVADKGEGYDLVAPWLGDGLLLTGGSKWHVRRKMIAPAFSAQILEQFNDVFNKHAAILEHKLRAQVDQPPFDVFPIMSLCALDVISETAMGVNIDAQRSNDSAYVKAVKDACRCFFLRQMFPWLKYEVPLRYSSVGRRFREAIAVLHGLTHRVIQEKSKEINHEIANIGAQEDDVGRKSKAVLLDFLLSKSLRGEGITNQDIADEVNTFLFAGHDTTVASLCFTLHLLATHPEVQESVWQEVRDVVGDADVVTSRHIADLKYLECVIKESLRLYPSVPNIFRHCAREFKLASGYVIPEGAQVGVDIASLHRDPSQFPDPLAFNPDRFMTGRAEDRHPYAYIPFSAAQRNCIGQKFAMMEMKVVLARLLSSFRVLPPYEGHRVRVKIEIVLGAVDGFPVQLQDRQRRQQQRPPSTTT